MATRKPAKKGPGSNPGPKIAEDEPYRAPSEYLWGGLVFNMPESPLTPRRKEPETGISRLQSAEAYRDRALSNQRMLLSLADRIQAGDDSLVAWECLMIAGAVRAYASQLNLSPPKGRGNPSTKLDPLLTVSRYIQLRSNGGLSRNSAIGELAVELNVSDTSIKKLLKRHDEQVRLWEQVALKPKA